MTDRPGWVLPFGTATGAALVALSVAFVGGRVTTPPPPPSALEVAAASCSTGGDLYVVTDKGATCLHVGNLGRIALGLTTSTAPAGAR